MSLPPSAEVVPSATDDLIEVSFTLNGEQVTVTAPPKRSALDVLRTDLGITTLKAGCSPQGVCGCCAALINGKNRVTCTLTIKTLQGKTVLTHDGIAPDEAAIYADSFADAGGTQCGYCTPGIVMATKGLLDTVEDPDDDAINKALNLHICRCTGWVKIVDSVKLAAVRRAELRAGGRPRPGALRGLVGESWRQDDVRAAVLGKCAYIDDMRRPGMLHGAIVWTPFARCKVEHIDTSVAETMPGVVSVCTAADLEGDRKVGLIYRDWTVLIAEGEETRCVADVLGVVAAETAEQARAAAAAVVVKVEEREPVTDVHVAARDPAMLLATSRVKKGDADAAFADCAAVVEEHFRTQVIDQAFLEPEATLVIPDGAGGFTVYSPGQGVYDDQKQLCALFGLPPEKVQVVLVPTGGGFGAKEDLNVQPHAMLLARATGRPVKLALSMEESARMHPKRHALWMHYKVGVDKDGHLVAVKARILGDTGGYASVGSKVLERAAGHACGPYKVDHVDVDAKTIYTNNPVAGAMRGFGVNQVAFALEGCLDRLADQVGIDRLELRARNLLGPGDRFCTGQLMDEGCGIQETLEAVRPHYDAARAAGKHVGVACGIKNVGMGNAFKERGAVELQVLSPSEVRLYTGFTEMGQGHDTVVAQMAAEASGLPARAFTVECNTRIAVDTGMTTASRGTFLGGNAARLAALKLGEALAGVGGDLSALVGKIFEGIYDAPQTHTPEGTTALLAAGKEPVTHYAFGYATQLAIIDQDGKLEEIVAAHDVGRAINRVSCEGQVEGGVHMGIGYALSEEQFVDDRGWPEQKYVKLGIIKARHMPRITTLLIEKPSPIGPWGAKGIGEIGLVPTAPAIASAMQSFDGIWRTVLPMRDSVTAKGVGARPSASKK